MGAPYGHTTLSLARLVGELSVFALALVPSIVESLRGTGLCPRARHRKLADQGSVAGVHVPGIVGLGEAQRHHLKAIETVELSTVTIACLDQVKDDLSEGGAGARGQSGLPRDGVARASSDALPPHDVPPTISSQVSSGSRRDAVVLQLTKYGYRLPGIPLTPLSEAGEQYLDGHTFVFSPTVGTWDGR